ncbi:acylphosphatase [Pedobacter sp. P26]|uniref:acylphosphatase n=1 Tax=Pedobacter sp. P26 TaxID=3423956 RepID=UPI003D66840F
MKHLNIKVTGKVQGVGFRETTKIIANQMMVNGFVRNEKDGSVYIEAEGEEIFWKNF